MKPWDRRSDETDPAWVAFQAYRDLGTDRTIKAVTALTGKRPATHRQLEHWSSRHDWVQRAAAWDRHLDQEVQRRLAKKFGDRAVQQANLGRNLQAAASAGLQRLFKMVPDPKAPGGHRLELNGTLRPQDIALLAKVGFEIERVAEGEASQRLDMGGSDGRLRVEIVDPRSLPDPREAKPT